MSLVVHLLAEPFDSSADRAARLETNSLAIQLIILQLGVVLCVSDPTANPNLFEAASAACIALCCVFALRAALYFSEELRDNQSASQMEALQREQVRGYCPELLFRF